MAETLNRVAQTSRMDPGSRTYQDWVLSKLAPVAAKPASSALRPTPAPAPSASVSRAVQRPFHAYVNSRPDIDWNTCGQAAIATILDYHGLNPFSLERSRIGADGRAYWDDGEAIDAVKAAGHESDVVFGWGTTPGRIADALRNYGLTADVGHSGVFSAGWEELWSSLQSYLAAGLPVPILLDLGAIGGPSFGAHWAVAYAFDGSRVHLGNCGWNPSPETDVFLHAWHAWFLPYGFNHGGVYASPAARSVRPRIAAAAPAITADRGPVTVDNLDLVRGDQSAQIFLISANKRRIVPDDHVLMALNPRGYDAVKTIPQDKLEAIPSGPPLPAMSDGTVLISQDGRAFRADHNRLRPAPDTATSLSLVGRINAAISLEDIRLLQDVIGEALPSITAASAESIAIDQYIRSLAPLPVEPEGETRGPITKRPGVTEVDDVDVEVYEQIVRLVQQVTDFTEISPISDVMWAGAVVTGASVQPGSLAPIVLNRYPGTLTLTTDLTRPFGRSQSRRLESPNVSTYIDTVNGLVEELDPTDGAAVTSYGMQKISTLEEGFVRFALNLKGSGFGVSAKARLDGRLERSTTFAKFSQAYYQVAFTPDGSPPQFFAEDVTLDEVKAYAGPDNPPCYIASVTYGRMLLFLVDSEASSLEVQAAINGHWTAAVSGDAEAEARYRNTMSRSSVSAVVVGGSSGAVGDVIQNPADNLLSWIKNQLAFTTDVPVVPIQYTVRYLAPPHNLVRVSRATEPVKIVDANVYGDREPRGSYEVTKGPGSAPVATGIRLNRGDELTITATGTIWDGWLFIGRNGPEGLDGPGKPWYPLPEVRGASLIAGYDNTNWFYVGSGWSDSVPPEFDDRELWFRINTDDLEKGNGAFHVNVSVRRRMPVINALG